MNPDTPLYIGGERADTRIWTVDLNQRVMGGLCVVFDTPHPKAERWDEATRFTWKESGVPVLLCHACKGGCWQGRIPLGMATLSRHEKIGIMAVVRLGKLMPPYSPRLADIAREPAAWGFSGEFDILERDSSDPAHILAARILAIGFGRWECMAASWYTLHPDEQPTHTVGASVMAADQGCCLINQPGCYFKPGTPPVWAGK